MVIASWLFAVRKAGIVQKVPIDLAGFSGYNGVEVIYLLGMAFAFPANTQRGLWLVDIEIRSAVSAADKEAQYDEKAKRLLGNKIILAHILVKTVDEFKGMNPKDVVSYIEGCYVPVAHDQHRPSWRRDSLLSAWSR